MAVVRALRIALLLLTASVVTSCGNGVTDAGGGPTKPLPQISFVTTDLSTGARVGRVQIYGGLDDVSAGLLSAVALKIRVATWPDDGEVTTTEVITSVPYAMLPNGAIQPASAEIENELDPTLDASAWYAISVAPQPATYTLPSAANAFAFDDGARGVRFSPEHPPVVASVMSCAKDGGVVAVYARYSEPLIWAASAPALDYGAAPISCNVGDNAPGETQFICSGTVSGQPFSLRIPDGVTAQASGMPMAAGTLDSTGTQTTSTNDGCTVYKRLAVD